MLAVVLTDGALTLSQRPTPEPRENDVVVAVRSAGLNAADLLQRQGFYPAPAGWPADIPGLEMAGVVSAVGDGVDVPLLGRRVCSIVGGGAQASHCLVPAEHLWFVPDHVTWDEAGGFAEAFTTAYDAMVTQGRLIEGERILISGASGGVGVAAVQIAHALGAHVTAVSRTSEHHAQLRELGADETITIDEVAEIDRVDVVLELVGAAHLGLAQRVLTTFARVVVIGVGGGGSRVEIDLRTIMSQRATITGSTLRSRSRAEKTDVMGRVTGSLGPRWITGALRMPIARSFDVTDVEEAYAYFAQPGKFGKVVVRFEG